MSRTDEIFEPALTGKKIPILTLDNKWHKLITRKDCPSEIKRMENEMNNLLKRQAKVNEESKELRKLKKTKMDEIVILADEMGKAPSKKLDKKLEECKETVTVCNEKIEACEEEMLELPRQINRLNHKLMLATMEICYSRLHKNTAELEEIDEWISNIRKELKKKVVRKQEKEAMNHMLYAYMHDIFGADVIEIFDMKYNPEEKSGKGKEPPKESDESESANKENEEGALKS